MMKKPTPMLPSPIVYRVLARDIIYTLQRNNVNCCGLFRKTSSTGTTNPRIFSKSQDSRGELVANFGNTTGIFLLPPYVILTKSMTLFIYSLALIYYDMNQLTYTKCGSVI